MAFGNREGAFHAGEHGRECLHERRLTANYSFVVLESWRLVESDVSCQRERGIWDGEAKTCFDEGRAIGRSRPFGVSCRRPYD
jgi:hypothetical protein